MNTKITIATIAAAAAFSSSAFAGELYGAVERSLNAAPTVAASVQPFETSVAVNGELYPSAYGVVDNAVASSAPRKPYVTTLAVGGELGTPNRDSNYGSSIFDSAFAE